MLNILNSESFSPFSPIIPFGSFIHKSTIYQKLPFYNVRFTKYGSMFSEINFYNSVRYLSIPKDNTKKIHYCKKCGCIIDNSKCSGCGSDYISNSQKYSLFRTRQKLKDYVLSNKWDLWGTFTFNPEKIDNSDLDSLYKKFSNFISNLKLRNPIYKNLYYIIVPEQHKKGGFHFHCLFGGITDYSDFYYSGINKNNSKVYHWDKTYNKFGFDFFVFITNNNLKDNLKIGSYISKYISKEFSISRINKPRFYNSKNLKHSIKTIEYLDYESFYNYQFLSINSAFHSYLLFTESKEFAFSNNYYCSASFIPLNKFQFSNISMSDILPIFQKK